MANFQTVYGVFKSLIIKKQHYEHIKSPRNSVRLKTEHSI
jgi:hypothetical protein